MQAVDGVLEADAEATTGARMFQQYWSRNRPEAMASFQRGLAAGFR
jgi:hypothetical protein